jgi:sulfite reductase beta subunit
VAPDIKDNYGKWLYHDILEPGVMMHVSETGTKLYTIRAAGTRLMTTMMVEALCKIADEFCGGVFRFTTRNNIEFMVTTSPRSRA